MKQTISLALVMVMTITGVFAKENQTAVKRATTKGDNVSVTYGQPSKNGRVIFGDATENALIPDGTLWVTGEGQAAVVTFTKDCLVGGNKKPIKAGTYSLVSKPSGGEWLFMFNSKKNISSTADFAQNKDKTVVTTWALTQHATTPVETFSITSQSDGLLLQWDKVSVLLPVIASN